MTLLICAEHPWPRSHVNLPSLAQSWGHICFSSQQGIAPLFPPNSRWWGCCALARSLGDLHRENQPRHRANPTEETLGRGFHKAFLL